MGGRIFRGSTHPDVFLSSYADQADQPEEYWRETLDQKGKCVFGLFDSDKPIGITAVFTKREDPSGQTGILAMSYIAEPYRRMGLSKLLYEARIGWALKHLPWTKLVVSHREGNEASRRANQAFGFQLDSKKAIKWPDGSEDEEWNYSLDLVTMRNRNPPSPQP